MASTAREPAPPTAATRLAWALCALSVGLALAGVVLAFVNGENLVELVAYHHAIRILTALVLAPVGALIVVGDRRHLLAWLLLVDSLALATFNFTEQYAPLALGLTPRRLSLPGGDLASWTNLPGIVISVVFLVLLFPDGRLPSRRWWPLGLAGAVVAVVPTVVLAADTWPLRGPGLVSSQGEAPSPVTAVFEITFLAALAVGAVCVVALVLRFRRAGAVQRQQIKWFAFGAALSIPRPARCRLRRAGPRPWAVGRWRGRTPSWVVAGATLAVAALFQPARRRVQAAVDRRFNRRRYDATRTIELQRAPPRPGGPGHAVGRAARDGRPDDAAGGGVVVAASLGRRPDPVCPGRGRVTHRPWLTTSEHRRSRRPPGRCSTSWPMSGTSPGTSSG